MAGIRPRFARVAVLQFRKFAALTNEIGDGRRERIRTSGPYVPNVVLYQAELHSVLKRGAFIALCRASGKTPSMPANDAKVDELDKGRFLRPLVEDAQSVSGNGPIMARPLDRITEGVVLLQ